MSVEWVRIDGPVADRGSFPNPFEIETPPGCEGWEEMYPYYALFDERRREADEQRLLVLELDALPAADAGVRRLLHRLAVRRDRVVAEPRVRRAAGDGDRLPLRQRLHLHLRQRRHRPGEDRRAGRILPGARGPLLRQLERALRQVAREGRGDDPRADRARGAGPAGVRAARGRLRERPQPALLRRPRRLQPHAPPGRPDVAAPQRVPAARLRRVHDVQRVLQGAPARHPRPAHRADGRGHRRHPLEARRRAPPARAPGDRLRRRRRVRRGEDTRRRSRASWPEASRAVPGWPSSSR